jgi:hypothetical protein
MAEIKPTTTKEHIVNIYNKKTRNEPYLSFTKRSKKTELCFVDCWVYGN